MAQLSEHSNVWLLKKCEGEYPCHAILCSHGGQGCIHLSRMFQTSASARFWNGFCCQARLDTADATTEFSVYHTTLYLFEHGE